MESAKAYLNETVTGTAIGSHALRRRLGARPRTAEREFLAAVGPVFSDVMEEHAAIGSSAAPRG